MKPIAINKTLHNHKHVHFHGVRRAKCKTCGDRKFVHAKPVGGGFRTKPCPDCQTPKSLL